jgi:hypothetical protein
MGVHRFAQSLERGLHHFFEAQVRNNIGWTENVLCSALVLQKNVTSFAADLTTEVFNGGRKLLPQMPLGVERPRNVGEKSIGDGRALVNTFFIALARALAGTSGTERWPTRFITCTKLLSKPVSVGV